MFYLISLPVFILAQGTGGFIPNGNTGISNPLTADSFTDLINNIAGWIFTLAIPLAALMFMFGGFQFLVQEAAKKRLPKQKNNALGSSRINGMFNWCRIYRDN